MKNEKQEMLLNIIKNSNFIVFFGGAGTSTESGVKDFRGKNGLYNEKYLNKYNPEEILSSNFFYSNRKIFNQYIDEKLNIDGILPNEGHKALVYLEKIGKLKAIITQNIDDLHQKAGSKNVIELHGTLKKWYCLNCGKTFNKNTNCNCGGIVRPNVTLYGEMLDEKTVETAIKYLSLADTLIIAGTSLTVYPAAYYIQYFKGKNLIIINNTPTSFDRNATLLIEENFATTMATLINDLKNK